MRKLWLGLVCLAPLLLFSCKSSRRSRESLQSEPVPERDGAVDPLAKNWFTDPALFESITKVFYFENPGFNVAGSRALAARLNSKFEVTRQRMTSFRVGASTVADPSLKSKPLLKEGFVEGQISKFKTLNVSKIADVKIDSKDIAVIVNYEKNTDLGRLLEPSPSKQEVYGNILYRKIEADDAGGMALAISLTPKKNRIKITADLERAGLYLPSVSYSRNQDFIYGSEFVRNMNSKKMILKAGSKGKYKVAGKESSYRVVGYSDLGNNTSQATVELKTGPRTQDTTYVRVTQMKGGEELEADFAEKIYMLDRLNPHPNTVDFVGANRVQKDGDFYTSYVTSLNKENSYEYYQGAQRSEKEKSYYLLGILEGLSHMHSQKVLHLGLKDEAPVQSLSSVSAMSPRIMSPRNSSSPTNANTFVDVFDDDSKLSKVQRWKNLGSENLNISHSKQYIPSYIGAVDINSLKKAESLYNLDIFGAGVALLQYRTGTKDMLDLIEQCCQVIGRGVGGSYLVDGGKLFRKLEPQLSSVVSSAERQLIRSMLTEPTVFKSAAQYAQDFRQANAIAAIIKPGTGPAQ